MKNLKKNYLPFLLTLFLKTIAARSNNEYQEGCLYKKFPDLYPHRRVCNSEDEDLSICRAETDFDYMEIRISSENWSSAILEAWLLQIVLSEILDVPTTIETGIWNNTAMNFYHPDNIFSPNRIGNDWSGLETASRLVDCRLAPKDVSNYKPCMHIITEVWDYSHREVFQQHVKNGDVELPQGLGALVQEGWYIPRFTAERDSSLLSYLGLVGKREKLAARFPRPTTWADYCALDSVNHCTETDLVAQRLPSKHEESRMFVENAFLGYFHNTSENDCTLNPDNCTGHIADYACGWSSYVGPQTHHLNIPLKSDGPEGSARGYSASQMIDIWKAANATSTDVIMMWWEPDALYQEFLGTGAEFMRVALPPPTQDCARHRVPTVDRCHEEFERRVGDARGACEMESHNLQKVISSSFALGEEEPIGIQSPAHQVLKSFSITELQINELFDYWIQDEDKDPRQAICNWVGNNLDYIQDLIPKTYPRKLTVQSENSPLQTIALILGLVALAVVLVTIYLVYRKRHHRVMVFAQVEFIFILLAGLLIIAVGAIMVAIPPANPICVSVIWLINLGYTLELVPLIVKVSAINRLMNAAKKLKRVIVRKTYLFGTVTFLIMLMTIYLCLWTGLDPPVKTYEYDMEKNQVTACPFCSSDHMVWYYISEGWNTFLLLCATVLAFQMRHVRQDFNESQTLAIMIYSHFFFVVFRLISFFLSSSVSRSILTPCLSLMYSLDAIATVFIYYVPKIIKNPQQPLNSRSSIRESTVYTSSDFKNKCRHCGMPFQSEDLLIYHKKDDASSDDEPAWCSTVEGITNNNAKDPTEPADCACHSDEEQMGQNKRCGKVLVN